MIMQSGNQELGNHCKTEKKTSFNKNAKMSEINYLDVISNFDKSPIEEMKAIKLKHFQKLTHSF